MFLNLWKVMHGSSLGIHTSELNNVSVQGFVGSLLIRHKRMDQESMKYLQTLFTVLWSIWNNRSALNCSKFVLQVP